MTHELQVLILAALLQVMQFAIYSVTANIQVVDRSGAVSVLARVKNGLAAPRRVLMDL
jgi:hypothetical protein